MVGREVAFERGAGEELVMGERTRGSVTFEWLDRRRGREGKRRGERGVPTSGWRLDRVRRRGARGPAREENGVAEPR
jgi:hypothetical protein